MQKKQLKISINGKQYSVATDEDDKDIYQAAELVDRLLKKNIERIPAIDESKAALVAALNLATDLIKSKNMLYIYEQRVEQLVGLLDKQL